MERWLVPLGDRRGCGWDPKLIEDVQAAPNERRPVADELVGAGGCLLPGVTGGGLAHCTLPPGSVSHAVRHETVEEIWYFIAGSGQVWRRQAERQETVDVSPGAAVTIPVGTHFQFRNTGDAPLEFVIATMPPWPGAAEAVRVADHWPVE